MTLVKSESQKIKDDIHSILRSLLMRKIFFLLTGILFMVCSVSVLAKTTEKPVIRVIGGKADDYKDSQGRIWFGGLQKFNIKDDDSWGGWIGTEPQTAEVKNLTDAAKAQADKAGYDHAIFHTVSWAKYPDTVQMGLRTGNGVFDVTYLVGEHWSPDNRGFDIFIEDENVAPLYVAPGADEIDIKIFKNVSVTDGVLNLNFAGNEETGKGDLNATFSGIEVIPVGKGTAVNPKAKLASVWAEIKKN